MLIYLVEDDNSIRELVAYTLHSAGFEAEGFERPSAFWRACAERRPDLVLLDLMLPGIPGETVLGEIRSNGKLPVIVLTAKDSLDDKVQVLIDGADDYITKPFEVREVIARIKVQLRRAQESDVAHDIITFKDMVLNKSTFQVSVCGKMLSKITRQEFAILELLLRNPKRVFCKEDIFEYAWNEPYMGETKTLDVHISNIRKKLKEVTAEEYIETVWGIGYRLHE